MTNKRFEFRSRSRIYLRTVNFILFLHFTILTILTIANNILYTSFYYLIIILFFPKTEYPIWPPFSNTNQPERFQTKNPR